MASRYRGERGYSVPKLSGHFQYNRGFFDICSTTCIGYAPSKGRRCQRQIGRPKREGAEDIVETIADDLLTSENVERSLRHVANLLLCYLHGHQADTAIEAWQWELQENPNCLRWPDTARGRSATSNTGPRLSPASAPAPYQTSYSTTTAAPPTPRTPRSLRVSPARAPQAEAARPSPTATSTANSANRASSASLAAGRAAMARQQEAAGTNEPRTQGTTRQSANTPPTPVPTSSARRASAPRSGPTCRTTHVERRPVDEECPICTEDMVSLSLEDLTWCKAQCGKSLHRDCLAMWHASNRIDPKCPMCRTSWSRDCEHDTQTPAVADTDHV